MPYYTLRDIDENLPKELADATIEQLRQHVFAVKENQYELISPVLAGKLVAMLKIQLATLQFDVEQLQAIQANLDAFKQALVGEVTKTDEHLFNFSSNPTNVRLNGLAGVYYTALDFATLSHIADQVFTDRHKNRGRVSYTNDAPLVDKIDDKTVYIEMQSHILPFLTLPQIKNQLDILNNPLDARTNFLKTARGTLDQMLKGHTETKSWKTMRTTLIKAAEAKLESLPEAEREQYGEMMTSIRKLDSSFTASSSRLFTGVKDGAANAGKSVAGAWHAATSYFKK